MADNNAIGQVGVPVIDMLLMTFSTGDQLDITPQMRSISIFEDLMSPVLTGTITISDNIGMFQKFPIHGEETLAIKFHSFQYSDQNRPCDYINRIFDILSISDVSQVNDYTMSYTLHFASTELKRSETIKISKAYQNTTVSNVIATIMTEDYDVDEPTGLGFPISAMSETVVRSPFIAGNDIEANYINADQYNNTELFIEKTKYTEPYISLPYMKPFDAINFLATRAIRLSPGRVATNTNESANFLFFENKRGYQFTSLDTLLENRVNAFTTFAYGNNLQNKALPDGTRDTQFEKIERLQIMNCYDVLSNIRNGMYSSRLYTYDMMTGEMLEHDYDYLKEFPNVETTEDQGSGTVYPQLDVGTDNTNPLTTKFLSKRMLLPFVPGRGIDNITSTTTERNNTTKQNTGMEEYIQKRLNSFARLNNYKVMLQVQGNSKHKVGDCVLLDLKDVNNSLTNDPNFIQTVPNKYYSGNYLITAIKHVVTHLEYTMTIELSKDSFANVKIGK